MITIAENTQYSLKIDIPKNRAFLKINGFWENHEDIPAYLHDWDEAIRNLSRGFTVLTDASSAVIHPEDVILIHSKAQDKIGNAGVRKVAELLALDRSVGESDTILAGNGMTKKSFYDRLEALRWLDQ